MCGFAGFISKEDNSHQIIEKMTHALVHRGPDHQAYERVKLNDKFAYLGHTRLSILDLDERSNQPFHFENLSLLYNGEIYNFKEIREELQSLGMSFDTEGDTEVAIKAFHQFGIKEGLKKFRGMFSFVLLDKEKECLTLIRDRVGVKPLYYYKNKETFLFASELKSFSQHTEFQKEISSEALSSYFKYGFITGRQSIFKNCFRVLPGEIITYDINSDHLSHFKYWSLKSCFEQEKTSLSKEQAKSKLLDILDESFNLRMVSDVPVGIFLSSGYDSTCVASLLSNRFDNLKTFTIGFNDPEQNEADYAKKISEILKTDHNELYCDENQALKIVSNYFDIYDEPFGDSSGIPTVLVSTFAKQKVKVSLSADGGDELFFGYSRYFSILKIKKSLILINPISKILIKGILPLASWIEKAFPFYNLKNRLIKLNDILSNKNYYDILAKVIMIFTQGEVDSIVKGNEKKAYREHDLTDLGVNGMQYWDAENYLPEDILVKVDRATMSASLEGREPFLDHKIFEFAGTLPLDYLYKDGVGKSIIKDIVHESLPKELMDRPKKGFSVPLKDWLLGPMKNELEALFNNHKLKNHVELNIEEIIKIKESFYKNPSLENPQKLWLVFCYLKWKERWV